MSHQRSLSTNITNKGSAGRPSFQTMQIFSVLREHPITGSTKAQGGVEEQGIRRL